MSNQFNKGQISKVRWFSLGLFILASLAVALPVMADFSQRQKITSIPRGVGAQFGNAVAIDGNTMVVGARFDGTTASQAGAAFVYVLSGTTWTQQAKLLASDGATADKFGYSVAISQDTIVVGAYNDDAPLSNGGSAYVFVRNGTTWTQQQKITASDGTADDEFGISVAIAGETVVVGAHFADLPGNSAAGSVYIFARNGTLWTQMQKLIPIGGVLLGDSFGESLAISGNKLVVGSPGADIPETAAGSVYVFVESGGAYSLQQKLSIPDGTNGDNFGFSVAIEGNTLVGGAREDTPIVGQPAYGAAYVFESNGATWTQQQKLTAADGAAFDRFGWSVAVSNNVVAVGAREDDTVVGPDAGSAYLFTRTGTTWTQKQKLGPDDSFNGDRFGASVALRSGMLVVGAAEKNLTSPNGQGAAYVFSSQARLTFPDFDGDGKSDISMFRPSNGTWYLLQSQAGLTATPFGTSSDDIAPADYDGDGKTDIAVFRAGTWFISRSNLGIATVQFGAVGDIPIPADFDGDGKADLCVFRPSNSTWIRLNSSDNLTITVPFGSNGDKPLIGDFDGDGKSDFSYFRPSNGNWGILRSSDNATSSTPFGISTDIPAPADYDGDGKTDIAVFRPSSGTWFIQNSGTGIVITQFGATGDLPVPADYDGDGHADMAVFRPSVGTWYLLRSQTQGFMAAQFGVASDLPIPLYFVRHFAPVAISVQFGAADFTAPESTSGAVINVTRTGDLSGTVTVEYASGDLTARQQTDYTVARGIISFGPSETSKSLNVLLVDDVYVEGNETLNLTLSNPTGGAVLGSPSTAVLTIVDNDTSSPTANPLDQPRFFVQEHYYDFLSRYPDLGGWDYWTASITQCGNDQACINRKRVDVSNAFYYELEFQQTGSYAYRLYRAAFGNNQPFPNPDNSNQTEANKLPSYAVFARDRARVVGGADLVQGQLDLANVFVGRPEFLAKYPASQDGPAFVDAVLATIGNDIGVNLNSQRTALITLFNSGGRGAVMYRLSDDNAQTNPINNRAFIDAEYNRAFVATQYFGFLRRDADIGGFLFWLFQVNSGPLRDVNKQHAMVCSFDTSAEYQLRFSPVVTHSNTECQ